MLLGRLCALLLGFRAITGEVTHLLAIPTLGLRTSNFCLSNVTTRAAARHGAKHTHREPSCSLRRRHGQAPCHACGYFGLHLGPKHCYVQALAWPKTHSGPANASRASHAKQQP